MDYITTISEERIRKAYEDGELDDLPGYGKPLEPDPLASVPEDLRMAYRVLKNAGYSPEESKIKQEMATLEDLIRKCEDREEQLLLQKKLNEKFLRFNKVLSQRRVKTNSSVFKNYQDKLNQKFGL